MGSSDEPPIIQPTLPLRLIILPLRKRIPKPQRLIPRTRHDRLTIRAHREIQHAVRMPRQQHDHVQCGVLPDAYLVLRGGKGEAVRRDQLV